MKYKLLIAIFFLFSCSKKKVASNEVIKIDIDNRSNQKLPELSIKSVTALETNDSSIFGFVKAMEYFSNRIYMFDPYSGKSLLVFSEDGNFINKTKFGKGPDELTRPFAFFIDRKNNNVLVWDHVLSSIYRYDLDLNLLSKNKFNGVPFIEFATINENELLVRSHYNQDYAYTYYNYETDSIIKQYIPDYEYEGSQSLFRSISKRKRILLISSFDYNVYQFIDNNIRSEYYFDFGKYKITEEDAKKKGLDTWKLIESGQRVSALHEIAESDNFLLFHIYNRNKPVYYVYSFENKKSYRINDYFDQGLLPKCAIRGTLEDDVFYATVDPLDMLDFQMDMNQKLVHDEIELHQNPFVITFSLSELAD